MPALADVSFELDPGECLLVLGPSGSGKSTLALAIAGLVPRELPGEWHGRLTVGDSEASDAGFADRSESVGIVFQDPASQIVMERVEDDVAFGLENRGWRRAAMLVRVGEALADVGLEGLDRHRSTTLSGGQQQRLALAGVLAPRPGVLVLDEPTANLDLPATAAFMERLSMLRAARAATIVLVEHRIELAWPLADRVLALGHDGRPIDLGTPDEVVARSGTTLVREGIWLPAAIEAELGVERTRPLTGHGPPLDANRGLVQARDVVFGYEPEAPVIRHVSLAIGAGERIGLVGPNGSGKSTLARLFVGLQRPTKGTVRLGGADPAALRASDLARRAGLVFQDPESQFLTETVGEEVMLGLRADEVDDVPELMEGLGLPIGVFADRSPYTLSGGEKRRLSLACVLARRPELLVLDEPTFGQDRLAYESLLEILRNRVRDGAAIVAATHDPRFVADVAERVIQLDEGRIVADVVVSASDLDGLRDDPEGIALDVTATSTAADHEPAGSGAR